MHISPDGKLLVLKKIGLRVVAIVITFVFLVSLAFALQYFKLNENVVIGIPEILVFYFWGGYFLRKLRWSKALGIVLFLIAIVSNFIFIISPYNTASEFKATRVFLLFPFLAGIFLILQKGKISRLMGVFVIILTALGALLGAAFCSSCRTYQTKIEQVQNKIITTDKFSIGFLAGWKQIEPLQRDI